MTALHPDLDAEQSYIDHAYDCLERTREAAWKLRTLNEADLGGTFQARFERNAFDEALIKRLADLDLGTASLVFGRIDRDPGQASDDDRAEYSFHIGRLAVADDDANPIVIDWRAPVAEPFYRATGREPMGLARRRHFAVDGRQLLGIEDELFGEGHLGVGHDDGLAESVGLRGYSTLMAALERSRTGSLGDIVATIQAEQDEIIRSPQGGVLVVQGGPGTGKTVVALHRAAYLLYTHRFPLEDQGVLVVGPNRVFLRYIEQVLPSLGEAGIDQVVLADLVPGVTFAHRDAGPDSEFAQRVKGDSRMSAVIDQAIRDRERPIRDDLVIPFRSGYLKLSVDESARIVKEARRRFRRHNSARRWVDTEVYTALADSWKSGEVSADAVRDEVRRIYEVRSMFEWMWPLLTPAELLHDLFGSTGLIRLATHRILHEDEAQVLYRPRSVSVDEVKWSSADAALLDDAFEALGPLPTKNGAVDEADEIRTYGHIVVDEVQDLSPMQLKMVARRSLNGSMTVVGDIAQATGVIPPRRWDDVLRFLPDRKQARKVGLSVGYRIPAQIMEIANKVMNAATPGLAEPTSVRLGDAEPHIAQVDNLAQGVIAEVEQLRVEAPDLSIAVVVDDARCDALSADLTRAGVDHGRVTTTGLDQLLTVVPVSVVKGLEIDAVIVVEPSEIVASSTNGLRLLYVALTRSTQRLSVVHRDDLPDAMT